MLNVVLAGGGTAGHTSPLLATAEALRAARPDVRLTCIGTSRGLETKVIPEAGLELKLIPAVPLPRKPNLDLLKVPARLAGAVAQAGRILVEAEADVLVGFGGYVSMPAYLAARRAGIPIVIQEQNAVPGLANRVAAHFAARVLVSFPDTPLPGAEFSGMPVRAAITKLASAGRTAAQPQARAALGLRDDQPVLLVSGGSQGARRLNNALVAAKTDLLGAGVQIVHIWGPKNFDDSHVVETDAHTGAGYHPLAYVDQMELVYAAADLMLARCGAGTVVETAVVGLPAIFVPLPIGNGEQARNAASVVAAGGAVLVPDDELDGSRLLGEALPRILDSSQLARMSAAEQRLMPTGAAERVAAVVLEAAEDPGRTVPGGLIRGVARTAIDGFGARLRKLARLRKDTK